MVVLYSLAKIHVSTWLVAWVAQTVEKYKSSENCQ